MKVIFIPLIILGLMWAVYDKPEKQGVNVEALELMQKHKGAIDVQKYNNEQYLTREKRVREIREMVRNFEEKR